MDITSPSTGFSAPSDGDQVPQQELQQVRTQQAQLTHKCRPRC